MKSGTWDILLAVILVLLGLALEPDGALGQNNGLTERSFVPSPVVRGMGDSGSALPGMEQGFFYNPAHLPQVSSHFTVLGIQGGGNRAIEEQVQFYNERVEPAIASNFDLSTDALASLHRDAATLGRRPGRAHGAILLPSFVYSPGALGVGGGVYAKTALNYRIDESGGGVPSVRLLSRTDVMVLASLGLDLRVIGGPGLAVGVTGTQTRRFLSFKDKPLGRFTEEEEAVLLNGSTYQIDVGLTYSPGWLTGVPGTVRIGAAAYDLLRHGYAYDSGGGSGRMPFLGDIVQQPENGGASQNGGEVRRGAEAFALNSSYRVGLAYQIPTLFFLDDVAVTADYQSYEESTQSPLARVHLGTRAQVAGPLRLRAGLSSGYPSGGFGLEVGAVHLDYSLHGIEEGRTTGQLRSYVHTVRLLLRLE